MAKKKNYSIRWENDAAVAFEINGVVYNSLDKILDPKDRRKIMAIMNAEKSANSDDQPIKPPVSSEGFFGFENIILSIFTGVAVVLLLIAGISSASAIGTLQKEKSAPGIVTDVVISREYINQKDRIIQVFYYPVVNFTAEDGRRRTVQMNVGSDLPEYEKGNEVTVLYDPEHPLDARIKSFESGAVMWILPVITGILGISFLVAVIAVRIVISREESSSAQTSE